MYKGIIILVCILGLSLQPTQGQSKKQEGQSKNQPREENSAKSPVVVDNSVTVITHANRQEQNDKAAKSTQNIIDKAWEDLAKDPKQWPNLIIAVLAGIGTIFAICAYFAARRQAKAAEEQLELAKEEFKLLISPRLYVVGVNSSNFEPDASNPTFFVSIRNDSQFTAHNVRVSIRLESSLNNVFYPKDPQIVKIPANATEEYYIPLSGTLSAETYNALTSANSPMRITGYFQEEKKKQVTYCYKYNSWIGDRPKDLPEFVPCEFDMSRTISTAVDGVTATATVGILTAKTENPAS